MKKILLSVLMITFLAVQSVFAHNHNKWQSKSPEDMAKFGTEFLTERLQLSGVQQNQVYAISLETVNKMQNLHTETNENMAAFRTGALRIAGVSDSKISNLLTKDQMVKYTDLKNEMQLKMQNRNKGNKTSQGLLFNNAGFNISDFLQPGYMQLLGSFLEPGHAQLLNSIIQSGNMQQVLTNFLQPANIMQLTSMLRR